MSLPLRHETASLRTDSAPLRAEPARNAVLNIFPDAPPKEKARPLADFRPAARQTPEEQAQDEANGAGRDSHSAFDLLDQASNVIPVLMARCRQLENDVAAAQDRTRSEMEAAELVAQRYQTIVQELQAKIKGLQNEIISMTERAQAAESQNEKIQVNADRQRQQAAEAECLTALFHDKVMAALGNNSPAHAVLQAMRQITNSAQAPAVASQRTRVA